MIEVGMSGHYRLEVRNAITHEIKMCENSIT